VEPIEVKEKISNLLALFQKLEELRSNTKTLDTLRAHLDYCRRAEEYLHGFRIRLSDIFADPEPAFHKFAQLAIAKGADAAAEDLQKNPDDYGSIKGWSFGPLNNPARAGILKLSLPAAVKTGLEGFSCHMRTGGGNYAREDLKRKIDAAQQKMTETENVVGATGRRIELELQIAELAKEISFRDLATLPKDQYRMVENLRDKYRTLIQATENDPAKRAQKALAAKNKK
jgi:hypothetical protein